MKGNGATDCRRNVVVCGWTWGLIHHAWTGAGILLPTGRYGSGPDGVKTIGVNWGAGTGMDAQDTRTAEGTSAPMGW
jgi:hypothetical protein